MSPRIARVQTRLAGCSIRAGEASGGPGPGLELTCEARVLLLPPPPPTLPPPHSIPGPGARAQCSSCFSGELLCACLAFVVFSFLPKAIKQHFLDSSLPGVLLPLLERTLCLPAPPHLLPAPVLNGGLSAFRQTYPQGSGPWLGHSVWPLPSRQAGPHPSPSSPANPSC